MTISLETNVGSLRLKNPVIAASGEHMIDEAGIRSAIVAGAGAVVVKSTNESQAAKDQLLRAEYVALGNDWEPVEWGPDAPRDATLVTRSGLTPLGFEEWIEQNLRMDMLAKQHDCLLVPSLILAGLDDAVLMAKAIEQAGFRAFEFNIGTPYASQAAKGAVSTELSPDRVAMITQTLRAAISTPFWIKVTGQSERVADLAQAAFDAGAESVVMAGRLLGLVPDLETQAPVLGTSCGIGGFWNLPLTCHWLALTRRQLGSERSLIGINGAASGRDVARMMLAGASAVGLSSAVMMRGFQFITDSIAELETYCREKQMNASDLVGIAADRRKSFADMPPLDNHWRKFTPAALPENQ
ncbi:MULTISPECIES: hypothetical protein [unclassified Mesorhizobium]